MAWNLRESDDPPIFIGAQAPQYVELQGDHSYDPSNLIEVDSNTEPDEESSEGDNSDSEADHSELLYGDFFNEIDYECDDILFDESIDKEVEWVGIEDAAAKQIVGKNMSPATEYNKKCPEKKSIIVASNSQFIIYQDDAEDPNFEFKVGMCFKTAEEFRLAIRLYATKQGRPIKFKKNCSNKIQVKCSCGWTIYASVLSKIDATFVVKTINGEHSCTRAEEAKHCGTKILADKYQTHLQSNPTWPVQSMKEIMSKEMEVDLSLWKMYKIKKRAIKLAEGTELEQYSALWDYLEECKNSDPDSTIKVKCNHVIGSKSSTFKRLYICWGALKKGFLEGCRPIICLDGTHLKTSTGGVLLTAIGIDGNNCMFPIAYAMVLIENTKTWEWFVGLLVEDLMITNSFAYTVISDKQKGLIKVIQKLLPNSEHRFCVRHMYNNFQQKHKGLALKELVWSAATSTRVVDFNRVMEQMKATDSAAFDWLQEKPAQQWSRSHFSTWSKCDMLLNNLCESFNKVILYARTKPIITMLEIIRLVLMKRSHTHRDKVMNSKGDICPNVQKILELNKKKCHEYILEWNGANKWEVKGCHGDKWLVNLKDKTCTCRKWDLKRIPCIHATTCILKHREKVENYVEKWYWKSFFMNAYAHPMGTVKSRKEWPKSAFLPLVPWAEWKPKVGRPRKHARRKESSELVIQLENGQKLKRFGSKYRCSSCGEVGHNKKGCKQPPKNKLSRTKFPVRRKSTISQMNTNMHPPIQHQDGSISVPVMTNSRTSRIFTDASINISDTQHI